MKQNHEINEVTDIFDIIKKEKEENKEIYFRGQKENYDKTTPSIDRDRLLENEDIMFKEFVLRNPEDFKGIRTTFEKLAKMQHYGLPTRLLDISSNPLIALFFAVEEDNESKDKDGVLILFNIPTIKVKYFDSDTVSVVSNIARRPFSQLNIRDLDQEKLNDNNDIQYLLHEIKDEKPYFKDIIEKKHLQSIWCVKPLMNNRRIIKQDGAFLIFGIGETKETLADYKTKDFEPIKYIISPKAKILLRNQLELLGITRDKIYPELETTAKYLKSKYEVILKK